MKAEGRLGKERNTGCIVESDAQSEQDSLQEKGSRGAGPPKTFGLSVPEI